jgi:hypothetical protein
VEVDEEGGGVVTQDAVVIQDRVGKLTDGLRGVETVA